MGKTSLCARCSEVIEVGHYVASDLIKRFKNLDHGLYKEVRDVGKNQETLISAIAEFVSHKTYVLDGHFVIRAQSDGLARIPIQTFEALAPLAIIVVVGDVVAASERIENRDGKLIDIATLDEMQAMEVEHAKTVASHLGVPCKLFEGDDSVAFTKLANGFMFPAKLTGSGR